MQKPLGAQGVHGELVVVKVSGGHEDAAAADEVALRLSKSSTAISAHCPTVGAGKATAELNAVAGILEAAVRPGPFGLPVSYTNVLLSDTRLKVNLGQTFSDESKVLELIVIDPAEVL